MNEWSKCCNAAALYFKCSDGSLEPWDFCSDCLDCTSYYEAEFPKKVKEIQTITDGYSGTLKEVEDDI